MVLTDDGLHRGIELRFPDEFVRHKVLDVVGDLALVGAPPRRARGRERPGHRATWRWRRSWSRARSARRARGRSSDIQQIFQYLPHRYPFLLVDRVVEFEERQAHRRAEERHHQRAVLRRATSPGTR